MNGKLVHVPRRFDQAHLDAGYHELEHGDHSRPGHELHGRHPNGMVVEHAEGAPVYGKRDEDGAVVLLSGSPTVGPEFRVTWPNGQAVTTLDADSVRVYLEGGV